MLKFLKSPNDTKNILLLLLKNTFKELLDDQNILLHFQPQP